MLIETKALTVLARLVQESLTRSGVELRTGFYPRMTIGDDHTYSEVPTLLVTIPYDTPLADVIEFLFNTFCVVGGQPLVALPPDKLSE
jgi:hypothetical protein